MTRNETIDKIVLVLVDNADKADRDKAIAILDEVFYGQPAVTTPGEGTDVAKMLKAMRAQRVAVGKMVREANA
jgi:hypothetical protein